jgi:hypothetical protein
MYVCNYTYIYLFICMYLFTYLNILTLKLFTRIRSNLERFSTDLLGELSWFSD